MDEHAAEYTAEECCKEAGQGGGEFGVFFERFTGNLGIKAFHFFDLFGLKRQAVCRVYPIDFHLIARWTISQNRNGRSDWEQKTDVYRRNFESFDY
jgi:hypothetical protein